jgi:hypothetical protein
MLVRESRHVFVQDCQFYPIIGSLGSSVKNMFWEKVEMYFLQDCQIYPIIGSFGSSVQNMF